ncbi:MAG: glutaredoxin, partial [uncultured bacterium]
NKRECEVVDFKQRKKILDRMKNIGSTEFWVTAVIGAVILAITVNIIEFVCSVGLPVIYTQVLAGQHESSAAKYGYILLYCLFYMLDDFIVFIAALFTSRVLTFSGNYSYYSRLVGAIILFLLAAWLVISGIPK